MRNKVALVTGATSGIGRAISQLLSEQGLIVILCGRRVDRLQEIQTAIRSQGGQAHAMALDVTDTAQVDAVLAQCIQQFGTLHVLVNNAGFGFWSALPETPMAEIDRMLAVNLRAPIYLCQKLVPLFKQQQAGSIINIASVAGQQGFSGMTHYCASKWGLRGFSEALLEELRPFGIKVGIVSPGMVNTEFFPSDFARKRQQMIQPEEVARAVWALLSVGEHATISEITIRPRMPVTE